MYKNNTKFNILFSYLIILYHKSIIYFLLIYKNTINIVIYSIFNTS